jgi:pyruvate formate lyase activating enzyme
MSVIGCIYNIQRYSLHDGSGIRTVVFLKGCPMRCRWCCNPESQNPQPEISYIKSKCIGKAFCGYCQKVCLQSAISFDSQGCAAIDRSKCIRCLDCARNCPAKAIRIEGWKITAEDVLNEVEKESVFYRNNTGGITISGGEPLHQGNFLLALLQEAKKRRVGTAIETCGFGDYGVLRQAALLLDTIYYDIKSINDEKHREWTGQSNTLILDNFQKLCMDFPALPKIVRTPVIPGFNDSDEAIGKIRSFVQSISDVTFEMLPYHRFGLGKYAALGRECTV